MTDIGGPVPIILKSVHIKSVTHIANICYSLFILVLKEIDYNLA